MREEYMNQNKIQIWNPYHQCHPCRCKRQQLSRRRCDATLEVTEPARDRAGAGCRQALLSLEAAPGAVRKPQWRGSGTGRAATVGDGGVSLATAGGGNASVGPGATSAAWATGFLGRGRRGGKSPAKQLQPLATVGDQEFAMDRNGKC